MDRNLTIQAIFRCEFLVSGRVPKSVKVLHPFGTVTKPCGVFAIHFTALVPAEI